MIAVVSPAVTEVDAPDERDVTFGGAHMADDH
jgi:hypothetical protein